MDHPPYVIDQLISAKSIAARIEELCHEIHDEFESTDKLVVVGLLRGSFVFIADLVRELDLPIEVDFLEASSYGDGMQSSREVRILKDLRGAIEGRDVLLVEDIVDTVVALQRAEWLQDGVYVGPRTNHDAYRDVLHGARTLSVSVPPAILTSGVMRTVYHRGYPR